MATELTTGLVIERDAMEWSAVRSAADRAAECKRVDLPRPDPEEEGSPARADALEGACRDIKGSVVLAAPAEDVLLRVVDLPTTDAAELAGMVELQVDGLSPFPVENMAVSHEVLARGEEGSTVLIAAARLDAIETLGEQARQAGLQCARVDVDILGWWRLLADAEALPPSGRHVAVLVPGGVPAIIVAEDGIPILFRSFGECRDLEQHELLDEIAREVGYTTMSLELERGSTDQSSLTVLHAAEEPAALVERLRAECVCEVSARSLDEIGCASEGVARRAAARGAWLDLTPPSWRELESTRLYRRRLSVTVSAVAGIWLLAALGFAGAFLFQARRLAWLQAEQERWRGPAMEVRATRRRVAMIRRYMDRSHSALECLREISAHQPPGVDLTTFHYRKGEGIEIGGLAGDVGKVYTFKKNLDGSALFPEAKLEGPRTMRKTGKQGFDIDLKLPGDDQSRGDG